MWRLETVIFAFAWEVYIAQEFFLGILSLFGNLLRDRKNPFDHFEAIIAEPPPLDPQMSGQF
jgi:hypothetical protein